MVVESKNNKTETNPQEKSPFVNIEQEKADLRKKEPPLVDVKVTNPLVYIKSWWKKIIGNEGIDLRLRVKPLTAIAISVIVVTLTLGIGRIVFSFKLPFFEYSLKDKVPIIPAGVLSRDTAFSGELRFDRTKNRYYLLTSTSEAINLKVPENINLSIYVGRRVFATGKYFDDSRTLEVDSAINLELLPSESETVPTTVPTEAILPSPISTP